MAAINFKNAEGRVHFDGGVTEGGKLILQSKTYRNSASAASAENLYQGLEELASLSSLPSIGMEVVETSSITN
ncbi:DUF1659 domain-containing protein [Sporosarcina sp. CAU 1771]